MTSADSTCCTLFDVKHASAAALLVLACASVTFAQPKKPISPFALDVHAFFPNLGQDAQTAKDLDVQPEEMPGRVFGLAIRAQVYPVRGRVRSLGLGFELLRGRGRKELLAGGQPTGVIVAQVLEGFAGLATLNFGHRNGWSYLVGGMGPVRVRPYVSDPRALPTPAPAGKIALTYGGGGRWFKTDHFGFSFDLRFYDLKPMATVATVPVTPGRGRQHLLLMSAGLAIR
jgi:hypothetical protein